MSMRMKVLLPALVSVVALAACGESPTSPTMPIPDGPAEPWGGTGSTGVLWSGRQAPSIRPASGGRAVQPVPARREDDGGR